MSKMVKNWIGKPFSQVWAMRVILNEVLIVVLSKGNKILQRLDLVYSFSLTRCHLQVAMQCNACHRTW